MDKDVPFEKVPLQLYLFSESAKENEEKLSFRKDRFSSFSFALFSFLPFPPNLCTFYKYNSLQINDVN